MKRCAICKKDGLETTSFGRYYLCKPCRDVINEKARIARAKTFIVKNQSGLCIWCGEPVLDSEKTKDTFMHKSCEPKRDWLKKCILHDKDKVLRFVATVEKMNAAKIAEQKKKEQEEQAEMSRKSAAAIKEKEEAEKRAKLEEDRVVLSAEHARILYLEEQNRKLSEQADKSKAAEKRAWYLFWQQKRS
jgi:hypothetical protein